MATTDHSGWLGSIQDLSVSLAIKPKVSELTSVSLPPTPTGKYHGAEIGGERVVIRPGLQYVIPKMISPIVNTALPSKVAPN